MTAGIHHVTAIAGPAARNVAFHALTLGQRMVKRTVNFDDPTTWHLYYGDASGQPGSVLTFFPWTHATPGRHGTGETGDTAFRVPIGSLPFWRARLSAAGVAVAPDVERFGQRILPFSDPDGTRLAVVETDGLADEAAWSGGEISAEHALRGLHGATLDVADPAATATILTDVLGFVPGGHDGPVSRFRAPTLLGGIVDLRAVPSRSRGRQGAGSVHHIAFRAADDAEQAAMVQRLADTHRLPTTEQKDRNYFRSIYFREPNGIIFEIATDAPGFAVDEPADALGRTLMLPTGLEHLRPRIEAALPPLE